MAAQGPGEARLEIKLVEVPSADLDTCFSIRKNVFVDEQGYDIKEELDGWDEASDHLLLLLHAEGATTPIGTVRLYAPRIKLGRLAVRSEYRKFGGGKRLVAALEDLVRQRQGKCAQFLEGQTEGRIQLGAQMIAKGFYEKLGYVAAGDVYLDEGQPHIMMYKTVQLVPAQA